MKKLWLIGLMFTCSQAFSQYPKLIVRFIDKGSNTYSLANPSAYLSARAIQRRTKQNLSIDSSDLPITARYLDSVRLAGNVIILSQSRWLNQILIQSTDANALAKIRKFPFVESLTGVGYRPANTQPRTKIEEELQTLAARPQHILGDVISYGNSYTQVHMHEGEFLHNKGFLAENVQVAILDAGFYSYKTNTAFDSVRLQNNVLGVKDFVAFDGSVSEDDLHGANCFTIMAANWPGKLVGTAPHASYWLLRTENGATEYPIEEFNWVAGAEYADSCGADIISSSLGYNQFDDDKFDHTYSQFYKNTTTISRGATWAAKKGMIVMNSAGNDGNASWKYIGFPADADSVCAVGAVNSSGQIASFSSYGYPGKVKPNIVSMGVSTVLAGQNGQTVTGNGTSYSNPNVAGLVACLWQAFPTFNNMQILDAVYKSADRYTAPTDRYGYGIPNFKTAYRSLKHQVNVATFGNDWLVATPNPFSSEVHGTFVGQVDGNSRIELLSPGGQVLFTAPYFTEKEEIYPFSFANLENLAGGTYTVKYADSLSTKVVAVQKFGQAGKDWIRLSPGNVFTGSLSIRLVAPDNGQAALRLFDVKCSMVAQQTFNTSLGQTLQLNFSLQNAAKGVYFLQYTSQTQSKTLRLLKL